ncbi:hypothetical protein H3Z83_11805 [Tenacibaculum sp. S7007]|uniref:Uncharacterized protein n=1 Tax=Tenacibaculum pelagium TaxID=2759527 RepID=A0A839AS85_9FLAO|nr:hypothetical protein [Tenacibaculum pelagium]MBA6157198.1 hypothetical protein [Tenacibaculum pelagium]
MKDILKSILLILIFLIGIIVSPFLWFISLFIGNDKTEYYHTIRKFIRREDNCNEHWNESFHSESDFIKFEKILEKKFTPIAQTISYSPKVKFLIYEYGAENWEGGLIYECANCKSLWELSHPENAYRGYFKSINLNKNEIEKYLKK